MISGMIDIRPFNNRAAFPALDHRATRQPVEGDPDVFAGSGVVVDGDNSHGDCAEEDDDGGHGVTDCAA